jgi:hypothetical protein
MQKLHKILLWTIAFVAIASTAVSATRLHLYKNISGDTGITSAIQNRIDIRSESNTNNLYKSAFLNNWLRSTINSHRKMNTTSGCLLGTKPGIRFTRCIAHNLIGKLTNVRILSFQTPPHEYSIRLLYIMTLATISISNSISHIPLNKGPTSNIQ